MIRVNLPRCTVYLTTEEMQHLLRQDPALWAVGIQRGKAIARASTQRKREGVLHEQRERIREQQELERLNLWE